MRPELLNPLFAEIEALKGVGPSLAKPLAKLGISRVVDLLFHLPTGMVERRRVETLGMADAGRGVIVTLTAQSYKSSSSHRAPFRVQASDSEGNYVSLVFFGGGSGDVSHVGLYVGVQDGRTMMVDAPHTGADVRVEAFPTTPGAAFGSEIFVGATRPAA